MLMATMQGSVDADAIAASLRTRIVDKQRKINEKLARITQFQQQQGQPLGLLPGFKSTGQTLTAMNTAKRAVDDLDFQIHNAFCKIDTTSDRAKAMRALGIMWVHSDCTPDSASFRASWGNFADEFYDWFLENIDWWSRFQETNQVYDEAQRYIQRTNDWRTAAKNAGVGVTGVATKPDPRKGLFEETGLASLITFAKWMAGIAVVAIVAPPLVRAVGDAVESRRRKTA